MSEGVDMRVKKSFLTNKIGPLPTWAWMLIGLGIAITISVVRADKKTGDAKVQEQSGAPGSELYGSSGGAGTIQEVGGSQRPPVVTQLFNTSIFQPAAAGRPDPPACAPPPSPACSGPSCTTLPKDCAPSGQWVRLASSCGPRRQTWAATLGGIAQHFKIGDAALIWNHPQNAQLKARRKDPKYLNAGDRIWVPACPPNPTVPTAPRPPSY